MTKRRYFLEIAYDGTNYHGWQMQKNAQSVQEVIQHCLSTLLATPTSITGSGRTDTGVHALQQYAHFDADLRITLSDLQYKINAFLPRDIAIKSIIPVTEKAHARYTAYLRSYKYFIHQQKDPFLNDRSYYLKETLDLDVMNLAARSILGAHDFKCFSKANTGVKHYLCNVNEAYWSQENGQLVFHISANRFLRGMVRSVVGTILMIGRGQLDQQGFRSLVAAGDHSKAGRAAPANGLFLTRVNYPDTIFI